MNVFKWLWNCCINGWSLWFVCNIHLDTISVTLDGFFFYQIYANRTWFCCWGNVLCNNLKCYFITDVWKCPLYYTFSLPFKDKKGNSTQYEMTAIKRETDETVKGSLYLLETVNRRIFSGKFYRLSWSS